MCYLKFTFYIFSLLDDDMFIFFMLHSTFYEPSTRFIVNIKKYCENKVKNLIRLQYKFNKKCKLFNFV